VPVDESNLVLKAARLFVRETGWKGGARFTLKKRIPVGAGLGGGSSNAVAALRALDRLAGTSLPREKLAEMAAALGSDCPLFLHDGPVVMRGRGEKIEALPSGAGARLSGRRVLVFKPSFGVPTAWAYQRMVARGGDYLSAAEAEQRLATWISGDVSAEKLTFNNMEPAAFGKYVGLPVLLEILRKDFGLEPRMSGSGSACYALLKDGHVGEPVIARIRDCWGAGAFALATKLA
jgi:4-diphosphocytidyl-2-C-methyl-D-erythritol kinase